jgi:LmbE family N-acetylglucosaminyl deacetylase
VISPVDDFKGKLLFIAPHMDDEALACGGLIALLPDKENIHLVYVTDGMKSPSPIVPGRDKISPDLGDIRVRESISAMTKLGVPEGNLKFLNFPEGKLKDAKAELKTELEKSISTIKPDFIFIPFRFDKHPDHLVINQTAVQIFQEKKSDVQIIEYFIYHRWRLLPGKDIRHYISSNHIIKIDISSVAQVKREALNSYKTQTTNFYAWQNRPILTSRLLDEECQNPEYFLKYDSAYQGSSIFDKSVALIHFAHQLEPTLVRWKYKTGALLNRVIRSNV